MKCRLCAMKTEPDKYEPLPEEELSSILGLVEKYLLIKISEEDDLHICKSCCHLLNQFNVFYQMAHENQKYLEDTRNDKKSEKQNLSEVITEVEVEQKDMEIATSNLDIFEINEFLEDPKHSESSVEIISQTESQILLNVKNDIEEEVEEFMSASNPNPQTLKEDYSSDDEDEEMSDEIKVQNEAKQPQTREELELEKLIEQQMKPRLRRAKKRNCKEHRQIDEIIAQNVELKCYRCSGDVTFKLFNDLKAHYRRKHEGAEGYVTCCERNIYNRPELVDHIKSHSDPEIFKCSLCDKKFQSRKYMDIHMATSHLSGDCSKYVCTFCKKGFPWASALRSHLDCHKTEKGHICDKCGASFAGHRRLMAHVNFVHNNVNQNTNYECNLCKRSLKLKGSVWRHMINHHHAVSLTNPTYCGVCQINFDSQTLCKSHMVKEHVSVGGNIAQCHICHKSFKSEESIKAHIIAMHVEKGAIAHFV